MYSTVARQSYTLQNGPLNISSTYLAPYSYYTITDYISYSGFTAPCLFCNFSLPSRFLLSPQLSRSLAINNLFYCLIVLEAGSPRSRCRQVCCDRSRPGRLMVFAQTEEYSRSCWDVWHAFIHGWVSHACCKHGSSEKPLPS